MKIYFLVLSVLLLLSSSVCAENVWNDGPKSGIGGSYLCTGYRCRSNTFAPFPNSVESVVTLTGAGLPGTFGTTQTDSLSAYDLRSKSSVATIGHFLYYPYKNSIGVWYLVKHNILSDEKEYVSLFDLAGGMTRSEEHTSELQSP